MLFIAAITSSVSMLQPVIAFLEEGFGLKRHASVALLGLITALGCGFVLVFSADMVALDTFDFWVGSVLIFLLALIQSIIYGWMFGIEAGEREAHEGAHIRIPRVVQYVLKYVVPVYLGVIFVAFCREKLPSADTPLFALPAEATPTADGPVGAALAAAFPAELAAGLTELRVTADQEASAWEIRDAKNAVKYRLAPDAEGQLTVFQHAPGYFEQIRGRPSAMASVAFLVTVFGFLLLLTHIAGRRWEKEGRLVYPT
jgi:hypothetical protein